MVESNILDPILGFHRFHVTVVHNPSLNCDTVSRVLDIVQACFQQHLIFDLQRGEESQVAWDPFSLAALQQIFHFVGLCV